MKKEILITEIDWDTDGADPKDIGLPDEVTIKNPSSEMIEELEDEGYSDIIEDWLSDEYGFCVYGFLAEVVCA